MTFQLWVLKSSTLGHMPAFQELPVGTDGQDRVNSSAWQSPASQSEAGLWDLQEARLGS